MSGKQVPWFMVSMVALGLVATAGIVLLFVAAFSGEPVKSPMVDQRPLPPLESRGRAVFVARGCMQCHSVDGREGIGPTMLNFWGSERKLSDGQTVLADEAHFRLAIREPLKQITAGFRPAMPAFGSSIAESDMQALMAYLKTLSSNNKPTEESRQAAGAGKMIGVQ